MHKSENQFLEPPVPDTRVNSKGFAFSETKKLVKFKLLYCQITLWKYSGKSIFYIFKY